MGRERKRASLSGGCYLMPADVAKIWDAINQIVPSETENQQIALAANLYNATALCVAEQKRRELAGAHKTLLAWCVEYRKKAKQVAEPIINQIGPAPALFDGRILALEQSLLSVRELVEPLPPRKSPWALIAEMVWQEACRVLKACGREAGTAPRSHAVRFTSAVLVQMGHKGATADAVARVVKNLNVTLRRIQRV